MNSVSYLILRVYNDSMGSRATPEKFWARVDIRGSNDCWNWLGGRTRDPYGNPSYGQLCYQRKFYVAHRLAWILTTGEIPDGLFLLHSCDNTRCCNPNHLRLGTQTDNMQDRKIRNRHIKRPRRDPVTGRYLKGT